MTNATILGGDLLASRADRIVTGLLLPYGEVGRTNLGRMTVPDGAFALPADPSVVTLNLDHQRNSPIGRAVALSSTPRGVVGTFSVAATPEGDAYLSDVESGRRRSLSAEVTDLVIRAGRAISGRIYGAAACERGAFPSATLLASDVGELPDYLADTESTSEATEEIVVEGVTYIRKSESSYKTTTTPKGDPPAESEEDTAVNDTDTGELAASAPPAATAPTSGAPLPRSATTANRRGPTSRELFASLSSAFASGSTRDLYAALDQVTSADVFDVVAQPQYLGELWNGVAFQPMFSPLINHGELTGPKVIGWRFVDGKKPAVGDYAGGGVEIPSNEVDTEAVEVTPSRLAGGWNVDRIHRDFPNPAFWDAFFRAANEDYARKIDAKVQAFLSTAANYTALEVVATEPATLGISAAAYKIVMGGLALTRSKRGKPNYAILADDLYEEFAFTRTDDALAYINATFGLDSSAGFSADKIVNDTDLADGTALVGIKGTATLHELGGASPTRVSAEDVAKGNLTEALFGYYALISHDKGALIHVSDAA